MTILIALAMAITGSVALVSTTSLDWIYAWLIAAGAVTFVVYGVDKDRAERNERASAKAKRRAERRPKEMQPPRRQYRRVPNPVMHGLAVLGGVGGAWLGRSVFDHKSSQAMYTLVLWLAAFLWFAIVVEVELT